MSYFAKPVHIQLSNKGAIISVFKISRERSLSECGYTFNYKILFVISPADDRVGLLILNKCKLTSSIYKSFYINRGVCIFFFVLLFIWVMSNIKSVFIIGYQRIYIHIKKSYAKNLDPNFTKFVSWLLIECFHTFLVILFMRVFYYKLKEILFQLLNI